MPLPNLFPEFPSYEDLASRFSCTEANYIQYCLDVGILRDRQFCSSCNLQMDLSECPTTRYRDGYCWTCPGKKHFCSVRKNSILENKKLTVRSFLLLLWLYCTHNSVSQAAVTASLNVKTVRGIFKAIRQCMVEDILDQQQNYKLGGVGEIVEIDESKFGKRKYHRGKRVVGKWVLGGIQRSNGQLFLVECEDNKRDHNTLMRAIIEHVHRGTLIITDKWKGYLHLDKHGYRHEDVNHSRGFVNPTTGAHTNGIEGSWFHAKRHMRRGQGKTRTDSLAMGAALQEYMWLKKQHITRSDADCRRLFSRELPLLFDRIFS